MKSNSSAQQTRKELDKYYGKSDPWMRMVYSGFNIFGLAM